jgi:hypothetical protein
LGIIDFEVIMLIIKLLKHYALLLRNYKQLAYITVFYAISSFSLDYLSLFVITPTWKFLLLALSFYVTGFFVAATTAMSLYAYTYRISSEVFARNLISGILFLPAEFFYWLLESYPSTWTLLLATFAFYYLLLVIICYNVEDVSPEKAFFIAFNFLVAYPANAIVQFLSYIILGTFYAGLLYLGSQSIVGLFVSNLLGDFILSLMIYLMTILYAIRYSTYQEIIFRVLREL